MSAKRADQLIPENVGDLKILQERSERLSKNHEVAQTPTNTISYIKIRLSDTELYGIPFTATKEVIHNYIVTKLPFVPSYVHGLINHHGLLLTVIDFKKYFNLKSLVTTADAQQYIIIVNHNALMMGFLADNIEGSDEYIAGKLDPSLPQLGNIKESHVIGLHYGRVAIINVESVLTDIATQLHSKITT